MDAMHIDPGNAARRGTHMNPTVNYLAHRDDSHYVASLPDSGVVVLRWNHLQLYLSSAHLLSVARFLEEARPRLASNALLGNSLYCVLQDEEGNIELWILGVGVYVTISEFDRLVGVLRESCYLVEMLSGEATRPNGERNCIC